MRESREVHDKLRELLSLKREINAFDRTREPAAGSRLLKSPVTSMSSRSPTGFSDNVVPRRSSDSDLRQVSITSPMQPPTRNNIDKGGSGQDREELGLNGLAHTLFRLEGDSLT